MLVTEDPAPSIDPEALRTELQEASPTTGDPWVAAASALLDLFEAARGLEETRAALQASRPDEETTRIALLEAAVGRRRSCLSRFSSGRPPSGRTRARDPGPVEDRGHRPLYLGDLRAAPPPSGAAWATWAGVLLDLAEAGLALERARAELTEATRTNAPAIVRVARYNQFETAVYGYEAQIDRAGISAGRARRTMPGTATPPRRGGDAP